jgi:UDP-glucose:(heptosyl)LPS alpha-1,3-glucosyltransferase
LSDILRIGLLQKRFGTVGGAERFVFNLAQGLLQKKAEVTVFCGQFTSDPACFPAGLKIVPTPFDNTNHYQEITSFSRSCERLVNAADFDILQTSDKVLFPVDVYRSGWGVHRVFQKIQQQELPFYKRFYQAWRPIERLIRYQEKMFLKGGYARQIVTISRKDKAAFLKYYQLKSHPQDYIEVIYNGYDAARFNTQAKSKWRAQVANQWQLKQELLALFVGNDFARKGLDLAIRGLAACRKRQTYNLLVLGDDDFGPYAKLAAELGVADLVKYVGKQDDIARFYKAADIFVLPSRFDAFANVCLEAAACGCVPLISAGAGGSEIIAPGQSGYVLPVEDSELLAGYLERLTDKRFRERMAAAQVARSRNFTLDVCVANYLRLYKRLLKSKSDKSQKNPKNS